MCEHTDLDTHTNTFLFQLVHFDRQQVGQRTGDCHFALLQCAYCNKQTTADFADLRLNCYYITLSYLLQFVAEFN